MSNYTEALRNFHEAFGVTAEGGLAATCRRRLVMHAEENSELEEALDELARSLKPEQKELTEAVARELADVLYIVAGTCDLLGISLDEAFRAVHEANMAKLPDCPVCEGRGCLGIVLDPQDAPEIISCGDCKGSGKGKPLRHPQTGKVQKPRSWQPPSMEAAVRD